MCEVLRRNGCVCRGGVDFLLRATSAMMALCVIVVIIGCIDKIFQFIEGCV